MYIYVYIYIPTPKGKVQREHSQALASGAQFQDQRQWAKTIMEEPLNNREHFVTVKVAYTGTG